MLSFRRACASGLPKALFPFCDIPSMSRSISSCCRFGGGWDVCMLVNFLKGLVNAAGVRLVPKEVGNRLDMKMN